MAKFTRIDKGCWIYKRGAIDQLLILKDSKRLRESLNTESRKVAESLVLPVQGRQGAPGSFGTDLHV